MNKEHSKIIQDAIAVLKLKAAEHYFHEEYGKYLRNEQSWDEFKAKIDAFEINS